MAGATETFAAPDDLGEIRASELHGSLGERLAAQAGEAFMGGVRTLHRVFEYGEAGGSLPPVEAPYMGELTAPPAAPELPIGDAKARIKQEGLEHHVKLPDQPGIKPAVLDLMVAHAHERRQHEAAVSRGPQGFFYDALGFVTEMGVGLIDPVNIAAFSIPVIGEARYGMMLAAAGESLIKRAGVRAVTGAAQGAVGGTALVPGEWWLHTKDGVDYTFADALRSVVLSAGMGGAFHAGGGLYGDLRARRRGVPLPGSPEELLVKGLLTGTHVEGRALAAEGIPLEEVPGIPRATETAPAGSPAPRPPGVALADRLRSRLGLDAHPAEVLADLPPRVQEDVARASIADVINGRDVRAGELLAEAGKDDPRIAESLEAWHGSPHDFERFDMSRVGTGEGAQRYGHGLYLAQREDTARQYSRTTTERDFIRKVQELYGEFDSPADAHAAIAESKDFTPGQKRLLAALEKDDWFGFEYPHQAVSAALRENPRNWDASPETLAAIRAVGNTYKVRLKVDQDHLLDWDKPLNKQSPHVMAALERFKELATKEKQAEGNTHPPQSAHMIGSNIGLDDFRRQLHYDFDQITASRLLNEAGIPGIKYLDQGSRGVDAAKAEARLAEVENQIANAPALWGNQAEMRIAQLKAEEAALHDAIARGSNPTHNFVVFDDKLIEITGKNGEPVTRAQLPVMTGRAGVDQVLREPYVAQAIANPKIVRDKDVPYGAGPNNKQDGVTNIDRHVPERDVVNGKEYDPAIPAAIHEQVEKFVMEALIEKAEAARGGKLNDGEMARIYEAAHHDYAEVAERAWVEAHLGADAWNEYQAHWAAWFKPIEHENPGNPPADLYAKPYPHDDVHLAPRTKETEFAGGRASGDVVHVRPPAARGPRARPEATWSLLEFIASRGGIDPADALAGDVRAAIGSANRFVPGFGNLIRKGGMRLDRMREAAIEAGYLNDVGFRGDRPSDTNVNTLLEAIDRELRGERVYRQGQEAPPSPAAREQHVAAIERELDGQLTDQGIDPGSLTDKTRKRVLEIMDREGERDALVALERAVMEESHYGAEAGEHQRVAEQIPGWDVPDDAGAAPRAGGAAAPGRQGAAGGPARGAGGGDREAPRDAGAGGRADWRRLTEAERRDDGDLAQASAEAKAEPEPPSTDPAKAPSAAEAAAKDAEQLLADILPKLNDEERAIFTDALNRLEQDKVAREQIVREGAECLLAATAAVA